MLLKFLQVLLFRLNCLIWLIIHQIRSKNVDILLASNQFLIVLLKMSLGLLSVRWMVIMKTLLLEFLLIIVNQKILFQHRSVRIIRFLMVNLDHLPRLSLWSFVFFRYWLRVLLRFCQCLGLIYFLLLFFGFSDLRYLACSYLFWMFLLIGYLNEWFF